jgi:hypothetical protein
MTGMTGEVNAGFRLQAPGRRRAGLQQPQRPVPAAVQELRPSKPDSDAAAWIPEESRQAMHLAHRLHGERVPPDDGKIAAWPGVRTCRLRAPNRPV